MSVPLTACSAALAAARTFTAIDRWAKNAPQGVLGPLDAFTVDLFALSIAPRKRLPRPGRTGRTP
ncbi:hypothetical protein U9R90_21885 [Streptomyces sp. E11-3]|uniref:hypothetical protein n=1 Tax=Streptomyces sp. E11-3 TaxID=3110112 RepID=UPI003980A61A